MSLIRKHVAVLQAWACLDLVHIYGITLIVEPAEVRDHRIIIVV